MAIPQLDLPIYLQQKGKKNLSPKVIAELDSAIEKLQRVKGEHKIYAWHNIAQIYVYQNRLNEALNFFEKAYQGDTSFIYFHNFVVALEKSGQYELAIDKILQYLKSNSINDDLLYYLLTLLFSYPIQSYIEQTKEILCHLNDEEYQLYHMFFNHIISHMKLLDKIQLNIDDYCFIQHIHDKVMNILYYQNDSYSKFYEMIESDGLFEETHIFEAEVEDILELNYLYEQEIEKLIKQGQLTIEKYIDIISKYNFSFVIHSETREEWENSCASS